MSSRVIEKRVTFPSSGDVVVGTLYLPEASSSGRLPAAVVLGPVTSVKEQAAGAHAHALAERGFAALAFDPRGFGESAGAPRQWESPSRKIADVRAAVDYLATLPEIDASAMHAVGVCAGGGYMAGAVAEEPRFRSFAAVAGFFHDANKQREWMGEAGLEAALGRAREAKRRYDETGEVVSIPAVGREGEVAMPLAEAFEYYGTKRGAVPNYANSFALLSRIDTLTYDAQSRAPQIKVPTIVVHSEKALAPALARNFFDALGGPKSIEWLESRGQIDFYDDPALIARAADLVAARFRAA